MERKHKKHSNRRQSVPPEDLRPSKYARKDSSGNNIPDLVPFQQILQVIEAVAKDKNTKLIERVELLEQQVSEMVTFFNQTQTRIVAAPLNEKQMYDAVSKTMYEPSPSPEQKARNRLSNSCDDLECSDSEVEYEDCDSSEDFEPIQKNSASKKEERDAEGDSFFYYRLAKAFRFPDAKDIKMNTNGKFSTDRSGKEQKEVVSMKQCSVVNTDIVRPDFEISRFIPTPDRNPWYVISVKFAAILLEFVSNKLAEQKKSIFVDNKYFNKLTHDISKRLKIPLNGENLKNRQSRAKLDNNISINA